MGVPRNKIDWSPRIDYEKCNFCDGDPQCMKFCPHDVYSIEEPPKKILVKNPDNCVVFCRACSKVCAPDALSFPNKQNVIAHIKEIRD